MPELADVLEISMTEERLPAHDPSHGTPHPVVRRLVMVRAHNATARFEQTDYGHAGRFNPWAPRGIDPRLQPRTTELLQLCDALTALAG